MSVGCELCRFFEKDNVTDGEVFGRCKRNAPTYNKDLNIAQWPPVDGGNWCGEWKTGNY